ncbi:MAG TPA: hypothetical protein P5567_15580 [Kiritimatiellia bacterium]|nr:hypothetical protein [Kiritimatiellia bacterium]HRZ13864.1 hypothetical protein [Kiritimatiellia bacterium]HSA19787.1 hypothetical protein [Kiritimatiellia bacterium]
MKLAISIVLILALSAMAQLPPWMAGVFVGEEAIEWTPESLGDTLVMYADTDGAYCSSTNGSPPDNSDRVTQLVLRVGGVATNAIQCPTFVSGFTNGLGALRFTQGETNVLYAATYSTYSNHTLFFVVSYTGAITSGTSAMYAETGNTGVGEGNAGYGALSSAWSGETFAYYHYYSAVYGWCLKTNYPAGANVTCVQWLYPSTNISAFINGTVIPDSLKARDSGARGFTTNHYPTCFPRIGSIYNIPYEFHVLSFLAFDSVLDEPDRQKVEGYLAHRYGFQDKLEASHPYKEGPP